MFGKPFHAAVTSQSRGVGVTLIDRASTRATVGLRSGAVLPDGEVTECGAELDDSGTAGERADRARGLGNAVALCGWPDSFRGRACPLRRQWLSRAITPLRGGAPRYPEGNHDSGPAHRRARYGMMRGVTGRLMLLDTASLYFRAYFGVPDSV